MIDVVAPQLNIGLDALRVQRALEVVGAVDGNVLPCALTGDDEDLALVVQVNIEVILRQVLEEQRGGVVVQGSSMKSFGK